MLCILLLAACGKSGSSPSIVGKWLLTRQATDANGNGKIDSSEVTIVDTRQDYELITFSPNGSIDILDTSNSPGGGSTYDHTIGTYIFDGKKITVTSNGQTRSEGVTSLTSSSLIAGPDTSTTGLYWAIFSRQP